MSHWRSEGRIWPELKSLMFKNVLFGLKTTNWSSNCGSKEFSRAEKAHSSLKGRIEPQKTLLGFKISLFKNELTEIFWAQKGSISIGLIGPLKVAIRLKKNCQG